MDITSLTTIYIILINIMLAVVLIRLLTKQSEINNIKTKSTIIFFSWLVFIGIFLEASILPQDISSFALFVIILLGVAIAGVILSPLFSALLKLPQEFLLFPQALRMFFGAVFIVEAAYNIIPINYGVIDGILHITTAYLATTLAIYIAHGYQSIKSLIAVNLFGLLDIIIVAYGIAFFILNDIGVNHNVFYAVFFAAPIFIWLHIISLFKIYKGDKK